MPNSVSHNRRFVLCLIVNGVSLCEFLRSRFSVAETLLFYIAEPTPA